MGDFFAWLGAVFGTFFAALPDAARALWHFSRGWVGVAIILGSALLTALFLLLAQRLRDEHGWMSAIFGSMAATIAAWWAFGIIPSAWVYYVDGERDILAGRIIPEAVDPVASNFYQVFRDSIVMVETIVAMGAFAALALAVQKRYPRALAEGEEARPQSGGYK